jgi:uncharacterized membrane protein
MDTEYKIPSVEEILKKIKPLRKVNVRSKENMGRLDRLACWITDHVGSMGFFLIIAIWTFSWLGWNILAPRAWRFDPYPAFVLWLFLSNMIQLLLMPLIMVGQNVQSAHADERAEADFEVNTTAEYEIETILRHLEVQNKMMIQILQRLDDRDKEPKPKS